MNLRCQIFSKIRSFNILFRHLKLNQKRKGKKMRRPIKAHLVNRSNRPVNRSNRPVYRSKPVTHAILNLDLNSNRSNRPVYRSKPITKAILNLDLNSTGFPPVSGQTGPVNRYRRAAVLPDRSGLLTLRGGDKQRMIHPSHVRLSLPRTCS